MKFFVDYTCPDYVLRYPELIASVHPKVSVGRLLDVARELDRRANTELNVGRQMVAEKLSRRAEELRELTRLDDTDVVHFKRAEMSAPWVQELCFAGRRA